MLSWEVLKYVWTHPANRHRKLRAIGTSIGWQVQKRLTGRCRDLPVFGNMQLRCYPYSRGAGMMIYTGGWYDYDDMHFVQRYLRPGDTVLDIGANVGIYTLLAASVVGKAGKVVAFEPGAESFHRLQENVELNRLQSQVELHRAAVGESRCTVKFHRKQDVSNRIAVDGDGQGDPDAFEEVPCVSIDEELGNYQFALGKIDIEGAELMAFRGAQAMLRAGNPPVWLLELKERLLKRFGGTARELADLLDAAGYQLATYDADQRAVTILDDPRNYDGNALAIHRSAMELVKQRLGG